MAAHGKWEVFGKGKTLVGVDPNDTDFKTVNKSGGTKTVTLTVNQIPAHNHNGNTWVLRDAGEGYKQRNNTAQSGTFNSPWENDGKWQTSNTGGGKRP